MAKKSFNGINIQFPISQLILSGEKSIETRTYPLPKTYTGKPMLLIETPGPSGNFKARIVALIQFEASFQYANAVEFYKDIARHHVSRRSPWAWQASKPKWGWPVKVIRKFPKPIQLNRRPGIKYSLNIELSI
jgi:hypothetical protein